eukprot:scaffold10297_cov113-Isochrysis_galbana.AAC.11
MARCTAPSSRTRSSKQWPSREMDRSRASTAPAARPAQSAEASSRVRAKWSTRLNPSSGRCMHKQYGSRRTLTSKSGPSWASKAWASGGDRPIPSANSTA